jgi:hypothetical protein
MKMTTMKKVVINFVVFLVLAEAASYLLIGKYQQLVDDMAESHFIGRVQLWNFEQIKRPHPFFGYLPPQKDSFERLDYLTLEPDNSIFRIGVFGGSVGEMLVKFWHRKEVLQNLLKRHPFFKNRSIEIYKFALGGYRQPQQFNIASLYGRSMDFVINVEGFNELTYQSELNFPLYYPLEVISHSYFSQPQAAIKTEKMLQRYNRTLSRAQWIDKFSWWNLPKLLLLVRQYQDGKKIKVTYDELKKFTRAFQYKPGVNHLELNRQFWIKMSCLQQTVLDQFGVPSLYFSQPVAFVDGLKELSSEEKSMVASADYKLIFGDTYHAALEENQSLDLIDSQFNYVDATKVFNGINDTLYIDGCCHLNRKGSRIFSQLIADKIIKVLEARKGLSRPCDLSKLLENKQQ